MQPAARHDAVLSGEWNAYATRRQAGSLRYNTDFAMMRHVHAIAVPRLTGTCGRESAARYISAELTKVGLTVEEHPFVFSTAASAVLKAALALTLAAVLASALLRRAAPAGSLGFMLVSVALLYFGHQLGVRLILHGTLRTPEVGDRKKGIQERLSTRLAAVLGQRIGGVNLVARFRDQGKNVGASQHRAPCGPQESEGTLAAHDTPGMAQMGLQNGCGHCHSERSEESPTPKADSLSKEILRFAQNDSKVLPELEPRHTPSGECLLLVAHYDSKGQSMSIVTRMLLVVLGGFFILLLSALAVLNIVVPEHGVWRMGLDISCAVSTGCLAGCLAALLTLRTNNDSPGAIDNASGVAALLEVARRLGEAPRMPDRARIEFLFTDAEELGLAGAAAFSAQYETQMPLVVNLDSPGGAELVAVCHRGPRFGKTAVAERNRLEGLILLLGELAGQSGLRLNVRSRIPGAMADHLPFALRGRPAVSILGKSAHARRVHTAEDIPESVCEAGMQAAVDLVLALADRVLLRNSSSIVATRRESS